MKTGEMIVSAMALSLAVAGCSKGNKGTPPPTAVVKTGQTYALKTPCPADVPSPTGDPYVITLARSFDLRNAVVGKSPNSQGPNPHAPSHAHKTKLDIVTQLVGGASGTIKIELADHSGLHFQDKDLALLGATANALAVFCNVQFDTTSGTDPRWLSFTVYPAGSYTTAAYNLGLLADDEGPPPRLQLPVIIDPWVDNNGVNLKSK
jgi:hypothetical protein